MGSYPLQGRPRLSDPLAGITAALGRRYAVERELGRGGMGTVYLALDRKHGRRVAIKVLPRDVAAAVGPERFLREIGIAARLSHPHILPLHDSGQAVGLLYYVMPYVEGESLRARLDQVPPLRVAEAIRIAREIADALAHAHVQGVIHRDVKPANILLQGYSSNPADATGDWHALLADFGVARAVGDGAITDSGLPIGTAAYASPEQAAGSRAVDPRSDVYALGCVLYEMVAAGPGAGARERLERRFAEPLRRPGELRQDAPPWLAEVVARATAPRPEDRFTTAAEMRGALDGRSLPALQATPAWAGAPAYRTRWMAAGAAALVSIVAALAFLPGRWHRSDTGRVVVAGFENKTGDSTLAPIGDIASDYIARSLATTQLLRDVYDARATAPEAGQAARGGIAAGRELAKRVGAGTVLGGSYYRERDSLHFEIQVVDAASGRLVLALQPVVGALHEETQVLEQLRQRVMGGFGMLFRPGFDMQGVGIPATYEAYEEMLAASDDLWQFKPDEAIDHLRRAIASDSGYTGAKVKLAYALAGAGGCREVDSLVRSLSRAGGQLAPADRGWLAYSRATCQNDRAAKFAAAKAIVQVAPQSVGATVLAGIDGIELSRPREALQVLRRFDAAHVPLSPQQHEVYWSFVGYAYHDLGQFSKELDATGPSTTSALAGLGDSGTVRRLVEGRLQQPAPDGPDFEGAECAALELRAHGSAPTAAALFERIADARGRDSAAAAGDGPCLWNLFSAQYYAGRLVDAKTAYARKAASDSADVQAHSALAAIAVRAGESTEVEAQRRWLAAHADALAMLGLARVAALQRRSQEAVELLRRAMNLDVSGILFTLTPISSRCAIIHHTAS